MELLQQTHDQLAVGLNRAEYMILLRPNGMLARASSSLVGVKIVQRQQGGILLVPTSQLEPLFAVSPNHALDLNLKKLLSAV